jgi:histidinol dehydrogenase
MEQVKTRSVEPQQRFALSEVTWDDLNEAGAYVEGGSAPQPS